MTTVKLTKTEVQTELTPSQELIKAANAEYSVTDARGRVIVLRKPPFLAQYKQVEMVGGELAANRVYMSMILPTLYVISIDGDAVTQPKTKLQLDALISRLDEDGMNAAFECWSENFAESKTPQEGEEELKKS